MVGVRELRRIARPNCAAAYHSPVYLETSKPSMLGCFTCSYVGQPLTPSSSARLYAAWLTVPSSPEPT